MDKHAELLEKLSTLRNGFVELLPPRLNEIQAAIEGLEQEPMNMERRATLHRLLHNLTGAAGTFGYHELSSEARILEQTLKTWLSEDDRGHPLPIDALPGLQAGFSRVRQLAENAGHIPAPELPFAVETGLSQAEERKRHIFIVDDDRLAGENLAVQLAHFGYSCRVLANLNCLVEEIHREIPDAVIMDITFPGGRLVGAEQMRTLQASLPRKLPVVFLSVNADIDARLAAVRAGADAYFTKPVDINPMVDRLDLLTLREVAEAYRILVVDDQVSMSLFHATILRSAGMEVAVCNDPLKVLERLPEFRPELIVMDIYMPGCSGVELAQVIRQQDTYVNLPIVFLSSESDSERQLEAIQSGGDEYLVKPIQPRHLISAVSVRAARYRVLMSMLQRDSLTGLYNHTASKEALARELSLARRNRSPLSLVMLDIDHFKRVNDRYGHPVGDQVIRSLARLLKQRLRSGDIVGRYGGEEFVVIMPGSAAAQAAKVVDQLRESFSQIAQNSQLGPFHSSFSAGLAQFPDQDDAEGLFDAADQALYRAKAQGRNQVALAEAPKQTS